MGCFFVKLGHRRMWLVSLLGIAARVGLSFPIEAIAPDFLGIREYGLFL